MKNQKGITLIALVITIIVMLILVGVSVTVALNGGLFTTAKNAADETETEKDKEMALSSGRVKVGGKWYDSLEDYKAGKESADQSETNGGEGGTGVTLTWTHTDANSNDTLDIGEVVAASNGESFYVIATPEDNEETVKLLAAKCVDTRAEIDGETNPNYNKQSDDYNKVAFDAGEEVYLNSGTYYKLGTTIPVTNVYANASIKGLVEAYVTETLGLNADQGMLMSYDEAGDLLSGYEDIILGTIIKGSYWLSSPLDSDAEPLAYLITDRGKEVSNTYLLWAGVYLERLWASSSYRNF